MERRRRRRRTGGLATSNCNEEQTTSGVGVGVGVHLPSPIIVDILSRLPTRSLLKCKCICKNWQYLIMHDLYFRKIRLARADILDDIVIPVNGSRRLFYLLELGEDSNYVHRTHWPMRFKIQSNKKLIGSCNGLFCLLNYYNRDTVYISNPILGESVALPKPKTDAKPFRVTYCFGFSPTTEEYKVLRFRLLPADYSTVDVHTLGTDTWRNVGDAPYPAHDYGVNLNGAVHWIDKRGTSIYPFDIDEEQVHPIPLPLELRNTYLDEVDLGVLGNCLSIYQNSINYLDMWSMKDYGVAESWTKLRILKTSILHEARLFPVTFWRDGEILISCMNGLLVSYNHEKGNFTALKVYYPKEKVYAFHAFSYRSSFFSLKDVASKGGLRVVNVKSKK
ncbi:F-box protein At3g07870-like [Cornus florida]|uniref:F-box protein At3g07870-like n=1 Tax=Cornus florida TaxID=4283 RepID=UPI0028992AC6|nr:F-box protein At3g07870-like [Cornus florida]